jgi:hypothetical protein
VEEAIKFVQDKIAANRCSAPAQKKFDAWMESNGVVEEVKKPVVVEIEPEEELDTTLTEQEIVEIDTMINEIEEEKRVEAEKMSKDEQVEMVGDMLEKEVVKEQSKAEAKKKPAAKPSAPKADKVIYSEDATIQRKAEGQIRWYVAYEKAIEENNEKRIGHYRYEIARRAFELGEELDTITFEASGVPAELRLQPVQKGTGHRNNGVSSVDKMFNRLNEIAKVKASLNADLEIEGMSEFGKIAIADQIVKCDKESEKIVAKLQKLVDDKGAEKLLANTKLEGVEFEAAEAILKTMENEVE